MERFDTDWVHDRVEQTMAAWYQCRSNGSLKRSHTYTGKEQDERQIAYDEALAAVARRYQPTAPSAEIPKTNANREHMIGLFARFAAQALDLPDEAIDLLTTEFLPVGVQLGSQARQFDPDLRVEEIIQASRNAWTACGLQPLLGKQIELTPAIFAYSLMYPYSDNYLDDEVVDVAAKTAFSHRFHRRLCGTVETGETARDRALWRLVDIIETQFPREQFPQVFDALLGIHQAQERSLAQSVRNSFAIAEDLLRLSCAKGGTSVLADACLAGGSLSAPESIFAFEWGVLLQLGDDLQDIHQDQQRGAQTLFTETVSRGGTLDELTWQLLRFAQHVGARMDALPHGSETLKNLLRMSWQSLILRAVADSHRHFSCSFLAEVEPLSPFRFEFLRTRSERLASQNGLYITIFQDLLN